MRLIVDSLIALMLVCILGAVLVHYQQEQRRLEDVRFVHRSLARLHEQATYRGALSDVMDRESASSEPRGHADRVLHFPRRVVPHWFDRELPLNVLVPLRQPWIDVAPADDMSDHPPDPVVRGSDQAGFWYNPNRGIFRARVPAQFSTKRTLELYNRVNGTALLALPETDRAAREPQPNPLTPEPGLRRAARESAATSLDRTVQRLRTTATVVLSGGPAVANAAVVDESAMEPRDTEAPDSEAAPFMVIETSEPRESERDGRRRPSLLNDDEPTESRD